MTYTNAGPEHTGGYSKYFKGRKITCDRCGFHYYKYEHADGKRIRKTKKGRWICDWCLDSNE